MYATANCDFTRYPAKESISSFKHLIIVRNPFSRIVSIYCMLYYNKGPIGVFIPPKDYTFEEYVTIMEERFHLDHHTALQSSGLEGVIFDTIIEIENLDEQMRIFCDSIGVAYPKTRDKGLNKSYSENDVVYDNPIFRIPLSEFKENMGCQDVIWNDKEKKNPAFVPHWTKFYNQELLDRVYKIYKKDFERFDFKIPVLE